MITFCQIRRREFFIFFVSILRVIYFHMFACYKNTHIIACPDLGKTFKFKIRMSQKRTCAQIIMQFWVILGHFGPFWAVLCPDFGKSFFPKTRMPQKGTCLCPIDAGCTPWKRQNIYFGNKNALKRDMPHPTRAPISPPENTKSFFPKTRTPVFGTVINDNPMITLW